MSRGVVTRIFVYAEDEPTNKKLVSMYPGEETSERETKDRGTLVVWEVTKDGLKALEQSRISCPELRFLVYREWSGNPVLTLYRPRARKRKRKQRVRGLIRRIREDQKKHA